MVSFYTLKWYPIPIVLLYKDPVVGTTPSVEMSYSRKNSSLVRSAHKLKSSVIPHSLCLSRALRFRYASLRDGLRPLIDRREIRNSLLTKTQRARRTPLRLSLSQEKKEKWLRRLKQSAVVRGNT